MRVAVREVVCEGDGVERQCVREVVCEGDGV